MNKTSTSTIFPTPTNQFGIKKIIQLSVLSVLGFILLVSTCSIFEPLDVHQLMCVQNPITGKLTWHTTAGIKLQMFGKITRYAKRNIYNFEFPIRFNDAGHAIMKGSVQFEMPFDKIHLDLIQSKFGSEYAVKTQLLQTVVNKCLYLTGPMMSSRESYAEKRSYLINYVQDQIQLGVYKTYARDTIIKDPISGTEKAITIIEIAQQNGVPARQEKPVLTEFGITTFNFSIEKLTYDQTVEQQIQQQQQMTMAVQTAMAEAKKAEQAAITAEANGKAEAAKAKWIQEAIKATAVTIAEKIRDSSKFMAEAADFVKREQTLLGEGEGNRKRAAMVANGYMDQKLSTWLESQRVWAEAFSNYKGNIVPQIQSGNSSGNGNGATQFMEIMGMKAAKDLGLDMSIKK
jgi:regulator of protease activity HflC (stomatin/prohibitin superfamily)